MLFGSHDRRRRLGAALSESLRKSLGIRSLSVRKNDTVKIIREIHAKYGREVHIIFMTKVDFKKQKEKALIKEIIKDHYILIGAEIFVSLVFK